MMDYLWPIGFILLIGFAIVCHSESKKNERLQKEIEGLSQIQKESEFCYAELEKNNAELRDLKKKLAEQEKSIEKYLSEGMNAKKDVQVVRHYTGNDFVDYVLKKRQSEAEQKGIVFDIEADSLPHFCCSEVDTITILDNLLENAVESCERVMKTGEEQHSEKLGKHNPFIKIVVSEGSELAIRKRIPDVEKFEKDVMQDDVICTGIYMENSKLEIERPLENHFETVKKQQALHGNGIHIIAELVEKYSGKVEYWDKGSTYCCLIVLPVDEMRYDR